MKSGKKTVEKKFSTLLTKEKIEDQVITVKLSSNLANSKGEENENSNTHRTDIDNLDRKIQTPLISGLHIKSNSMISEFLDSPSKPALPPSYTITDLKEEEEFDDIVIESTYRPKKIGERIDNTTVVSDGNVENNSLKENSKTPRAAAKQSEPKLGGSSLEELLNQRRA